MTAENHILIIDDNADLCHSLRKVFEDNGYRVTTAHTGEEGLAILQRDTVDVTLLDVCLPDALGTELLPVIRQIDPDMPALLITTSASLDTAMQALNMGAYAYLTKPLDVGAVLNAVQRVLERSYLIEQERRLTGQLQTLNRAALLINSELQLERALRTVADLARDLVGAHYAAVILTDQNESEAPGVVAFYFAGNDPEARASFTDMPGCESLMSLLVRQAEPLRLDDLGQHAALASSDSKQPEIANLLSVPILLRGRLLGNLCLSDKGSESGAEPFTETDQQVIETLAAQAAVAIENVRLHEADRQRTTALEITTHEFEQQSIERDESERARDRLIAELQNALAEVKVLSGLLPICMYCKKIRADAGDWQQLEVYFRGRSDAEFSHGICPDCMNKFCSDVLGE